MPQEIRVLCCVECKMYQVDIVKKAKKWQCKMCGKKQSVFKEFFRGSGAECRKRAQELNLTTNTEQSEVENELLNLLEQDDLDVDFEIIANQERKQVISNVKPAESKWAKYVDPSEEKRYEGERIMEIKKRKTQSNSSASNSAQCPKSFVSANSKWNAYV